MRIVTIDMVKRLPARYFEVWSAFDRVVAELAKPKTPREEADHEREVDALEAERDRQLRELGGAIDRGIAQNRNAIERTLRADSGPRADEIASAWNDRVKPMLDKGLGIAEILKLRSLTRADVVALRQNAEPYLLAEAGPDAMPEVERSLDSARDAIDAAEWNFMPEDIASAARAARDLERVEQGVVFVRDGYQRMRANGWQPSPQERSMQEMSGAFALAQILDDPSIATVTPGDWHESLDRADPGWRAEVGRNSLEPRLRESLNDQARQVGFAPSVRDRAPE